MMKTQTHLRPLSLIMAACSLTLVVAVLHHYQQSLNARIISGYDEIEIMPRDFITIGTDSSYTFEVCGLFGQGFGSITLRADWSVLTGDHLGTLSDCTNSHTCTFTAGAESGEVTIVAKIVASNEQAYKQFAIEDGMPVSPPSDPLTQNSSSSSAQSEEGGEASSTSSSSAQSSSQSSSMQQSSSSSTQSSSSSSFSQSSTQASSSSQTTSSSSSSADFSVPYNRNPFIDELPAWAEEAIISLHEKGIIQGYENGKFGPADPVTEGQYITLLSRLLHAEGLVILPTDCTQYFADVPLEHFASVPVCLFFSQEWIPVLASPDILNVDSLLYRGRAAQYLNNAAGKTLLAALGAPSGGGVRYSDVLENDIDFQAITTLSQAEIMTGKGDGSFGSTDNLIRAEVAVVLHRLMQKINEYDITTLQEFDESINYNMPSAKRDGDPCEDGNYCTVNDTYWNGICVAGVTKECGDDDNACTRYPVCDPVSGACIAEPFPDDAQFRCDDGNYLTVNDVCIGGKCQGEIPAALQDGDPCEDGNLCTVNDTYWNGRCVTGENKHCDDDGNFCTRSACSPSTGDCIATPVPDNIIPCDDGDPNTDRSTCVGGLCIGSSTGSKSSNGACLATSYTYQIAADLEDAGTVSPIGYTSYYAKQHIPGMNNVNILQFLCTQAIFDEVMQNFCAIDGAPDNALLYVVSYDENTGKPNMVRPWARGKGGKCP